MKRLRNKLGIALLKFAIVALYASGKCRLVSDLCMRLQQRLAPVAETIDEAEHEKSEPDKYSLDLIAWRGDDGETVISFEVTQSECPVIRSVGPVLDDDDDDDYGKYPLSALAERLVWKGGKP